MLARIVLAAVLALESAVPLIGALTIVYFRAIGLDLNDFSFDNEPKIPPTPLYVDVAWMAVLLASCAVLLTSAHSLLREVPAQSWARGIYAVALVAASMANGASLAYIYGVELTPTYFSDTVLWSVFFAIMTLACALALVRQLSPRGFTMGRPAR
jgi:hypothetical protein